MKRRWGEPALVLVLYTTACVAVGQAQSCAVDPRTGQLVCGAGGDVTKSARTANFIVSAGDARVARELADVAERSRRELATWLLGRVLPDWREPCRVTVRLREGTSGGGGTSFVVTGAEPRGWRMNLVGTRAQLARSVIPHEVMHCVLVTHFRHPLPRWLDEGLAACVEGDEEVQRYERTVVRVLQSGRGIALGDLLAAREYPADHEAFYAQSHSLVCWLLEQRGRETLLRVAREAMRGDDWAGVLPRAYEFDSLRAMQDAWLGWLRAGRPRGEHASAPPRPTRVEPDRGPIWPRDAIARVRVGDSAGTGSLVAPDLVLTCWHLFRDQPAAAVIVELPEGRYRGGLAVHDAVNDLALVRLERPARARPLIVGEYEDGGEELWSCGWGGGDWATFRGRPAGWVTPGHAANQSRALVIAGMATRPGDSGAPLLDGRMRLVGVVWGNDGRAYGCVGQPLRMLLDRVLPGRPGVLVPHADWQVIGGIEPRANPDTTTPRGPDSRGPTDSPPARNTTPRGPDSRGPTDSPPVTITTPRPARGARHVARWFFQTWSWWAGLGGGGVAGVATWWFVRWWWCRRARSAIPKNDGRFVDIPRADDEAMQRAERGAMTRLRQTQPSAVPTVRQFQRFRDTRFVPFEVDSFAHADQEAMRAFVDRYPGATYVLEAFKGMRDQFLRGLSQ